MITSTKNRNSQHDQRLVLSLPKDFQIIILNFGGTYMSQYELTFLLNEEAELKVLKELVTSLEGEVTKEEKWGEKTLAYPIKSTYKAHYYHWKLSVPTKQVMELRKRLNYNEKLIRYLLLAV